MSNLLKLVFLIASSALLAAAADLSGTYSSGAGDRAGSTLTMKVKGDTVTGVLKNQLGEFPLQNGSVEGTDVFFNVFVDRDGDRFKMTYRGHAFGEEIQFKIEAGERVLDLIVKKAS